MIYGKESLISKPAIIWTESWQMQCANSMYVFGIGLCTMQHSTYKLPLQHINKGMF